MQVGLVWRLVMVGLLGTSLWLSPLAFATVQPGGTTDEEEMWGMTDEEEMQGMADEEEEEGTDDEDDEEEEEETDDQETRL